MTANRASFSWLAVFPAHLKEMLSSLPEQQLASFEEIRLRIGQPIECICHGQSLFLTPKGELGRWLSTGYRFTAEDGTKMLNIISNHSLYTLEEELRRGYVTVQGGHRVGISGKVILEKGGVKGIRDISSFNVRIAREVIGAANGVMPVLWDRRRKEIYHTLIISPPQCGKTTLIRDIARQISYGHSPLPRGFKVGIVDERSEIAGSLRGVPQKDVGPRTDVLDGCPKAEGMMMLIRSMSPEVLVVDEIGGEKDTQALLEAVHAGVKVITTAHGWDYVDVLRRPSLAPLLSRWAFERVIILNRERGPGTVQAVLDRDGKPVTTGGNAG
ncbi:MAG: stage III sporulation protein AA [Bacillaceae bacterium G1]|nr:stage III sporulation protein AA [Bacillota bacterium]OJF17017.1 MAG: stage III sporulation protein AA [Bacillaceae bacterium G1]